jgi:hypothetical protein
METGSGSRSIRFGISSVKQSPSPSSGVASSELGSAHTHKDGSVLCVPRYEYA